MVVGCLLLKAIELVNGGGPFGSCHFHINRLGVGSFFLCFYINNFCGFCMQMCLELVHSCDTWCVCLELVHSVFMEE